MTIIEHESKQRNAHASRHLYKLWYERVYGCGAGCDLQKYPVFYRHFVTSEDTTLQQLSKTQSTVYVTETTLVIE